ncbi:MAG: alpha/beta hydrolase [Alphaproteobacteria bacterium]|nr:alpha/beta hydrolase [Alphaproteobacteria bacterium]
MHLTWRDQPAPAVDVMPGHTSINATSGQIETTPLADAVLDAARALGRDLASKGAAPPHIRTLTISTTDPKSFEAALPEIGLLYREILGGNFGDIALVKGDSFNFTAVAHIPPVSKEVVFMDYDRAELSAEYSPRISVPEAPQIMAAWRVDGTEHQKTRSAEVSYGTDTAHKIDLYLPKGIKAPPLHVYIHGGYWQALDKKDNGHLCRNLVEEGIAVATLNYPLCPPATIGDIVTDCRNALAYLYQTAEQNGYNGEWITISGHSAGGHLVAMLAATHWPQIDPDLPRDLIKGTVSISGLFDLEPLRHIGLNNALRLTEDDARTLSPILLNLVSNAPFIAAVGGAESEEFRRQSLDYADHWRDRRKDIDYLELPGLNHFTAVEALADTDSPLYKKVVELAKPKV